MKEQYIKIDRDGCKLYYSDKEMTILHREDGPAAEYANGSEVWYLNGKLHREDGPASQFIDGGNHWYLNGARHREDGPAIEYTDSAYKAWYQNDQRHREDGPAIEDVDGNYWFVNGKQLSEEEFNQYTKPSQDGKVVEVDGRKYTLKEL